MASLIASCLARLVREGKVTQKTADDALALHEGLQARLVGAMPPASAEAAAALETARIIARVAQEKRASIQRQVLRQVENEERIAAHPRGRAAGLMGILTRDIYQRGGINIESQHEAVLGRLFKAAFAVMENYKAGPAGLRQDVAGIRNMIREVKGRDTGDQIAKDAAAGWRAATQYAVDRVKSAGRMLSVLDDWDYPQHWTPERYRKFSEDEWTNDVMREVRAGGMEIMDRATGAPAAALRIPAILQDAHQKISLGRVGAATDGAGSASAFSQDMRIFRFKDPEAWLRMSDKYGAGRGGIYNLLAGHLDSMAREIALVETLGPDYHAAFRHLRDLAEAEQQSVDPLKRAERAALGGSIRAAERAFDYVTGRTGGVVSEFMAGVFGGLRAIGVSAQLGSAAISAIPGDSVTSIFAARRNGIPAIRLLTGTLRDITTSGRNKRARAARLALVAHAVSDIGIGVKRFEDQIIGNGVPQKFARLIMSVTGLNAWTQGRKRIWSMEFLGTVADQASRGWDRVDKQFRAFLERYQFTPDEWETLRQAPLLDFDGATFFDVGAVGDQRLADKLMGAILDERQFAVIEANARTAQVTAAGAPRGTWTGEIARSAWMYKSFPMSVIYTHLFSALGTGPMWSRPLRLAAFVTAMTVAGAAAYQARQILTGKDPRRMDNVPFWLQAGLTGGALGIYGDLVGAATQTRTDLNVYETAAGPVLGELVHGGVLATNTAAAALSHLFGSGEIDAPNLGRELYGFMRRWTPGSNAWMTRLAVDRLLYDNIQRMIDPAYEDAWRRTERRMRQDYGQGFWWAPGTNAPQRAPSVGGALGR